MDSCLNAQTGLKKLRDIKKAPIVLLQLNNEISELQILLHAVQEAAENGSSIQDLQPQHLTDVLQRAKKSILDLEMAIQYDILKPAGGRISKLACLKHGPRLKDLHDELRSFRLAIGNTVTVENYRFRRDFRRDLQKHKSELAQHVSLVLTEISHAPFPIPENQCEKEASMSLITDSKCSSSISQQHSLGNYQKVQNDACLTNHKTSSNYSDCGLPGSRLSFSVMSGPRCSPFCQCRCHNGISLSQKRLHTTLGSLLSGYVALNVATAACDLPAHCPRKWRANVSYAFPSWFSNMAMHATISYAMSQGPELLIRVSHRRDLEDLEFAVALGRIDVLQKQMTAGFVSVRD